MWPPAPSATSPCSWPRGSPSTPPCGRSGATRHGAPGRRLPSGSTPAASTAGCPAPASCAAGTARWPTTRPRRSACGWSRATARASCARCTAPSPGSGGRPPRSWTGASGRSSASPSGPRRRAGRPGYERGCEPGVVLTREDPAKRSWWARVPRPPAPDPLDAFSEDEVRTCVAYAKPRQRWALLGVAVDLSLLAGVALTTPGRELVRWAVGLGGGWAPARVALAAVAVIGVRALARLPFSIRAFRQDVRAGLATQRLAGFLRDWLKARAVGLVLTVLPLAGLVLAARWRPPGWPWVAAVAAAALVAVLALLGPVLIEPLFNRFTSLHAGPLRDRLLLLAAGMRVPVRDVLVADASRRTTRVNAYVSGLGRTRRMVVYDTLVRSPTAAPRPHGAAGDGPVAPAAARNDEIAMVIAHELAHVRHRDVLWGTVAGAAAAAGAVLAATWLLELDRLC